MKKNKQKIAAHDLYKIFAAYWGARMEYTYPKDGAATVLNVPVCAYSLNNLAAGKKYNNPIMCLYPLVRIQDEDAVFIYETIVGQVAGEKYIVSRNKTDTNIESRYNVDRSDEDRVTVYIPHSLEIYWNDGGKIKEVDGIRMQIIIDYLRSSVRPDGTPKPAYNVGYGPYLPKDLISLRIAKHVKPSK